MKENLLNLIGWKFKRKKRGFTLIELNVSMLIQLIILTIAINTSLITVKNHFKVLNYVKFQDSFDDAILNIERLLKSYMIESINIEEDQVNSKGKIEVIYRKDNNETDIKKKIIYFDKSNNKIILKTLSRNNYKYGFNILMINVSDFSITKKGNIYYLKITNVNKDERVICI